MKKKSLVLDTSLFVNPDSARFYGENPTQAFKKFLELAAGAINLEFWMPPSVFSELMHFVEEAGIPEKMLMPIHRKPPKKHEIRIPGIFLYKLVAEVRDRTDRSLRLSEKCVREALRQSPPPEKFGKPGEIHPDSQAISHLRENFRRMTREGMIDSAEDVDLLLLSYEMSAALVTCDLGLVHWAHELGVSTISHQRLVELLKVK